MPATPKRALSFAVPAESEDGWQAGKPSQILAVRPGRDSGGVGEALEVGPDRPDATLRP